MAKPVVSQLTISCLQSDWSVETVKTPSQVSSAFLEAALSHTNAHPQHALEVVQRLRLNSENYVEPEPSAPEPPAQDEPTQVARDAAARRDPGIQTGFLDRSRREH